MNKSDNEAANISLVQCLKNGIGSFVGNFRRIAKSMLVLSVVIAVVAAVGFGGKIGVVKTDYITYMPFHEISMVAFLKYAVAALLVVVAGLFWRGKVFLMFMPDGGANIEKKATLFAGLRYVQFCLLAYIAFGIIATALAVLAVKISVWLWIALAIYIMVIAVPVYVAEYEYMFADNNFRTSLRASFKAVKEQWGRLFLRLLITYAAWALLVAVVMLPSAVLALAVYDNATAVSMEGATETPAFVYVLEYLFIALGMIASLAVTYCAMSVLKSFFEESKVYSSALEQAREDEF